MVSIVLRETQVYDDSREFYKFEQDGKTNYEIFMVEGYKGDRRHTFVRNTDYALSADGVLWLSGDRPEAPPSFISASGKITFDVTYSYEESPDTVMIRWIHPHVREDGVFIMFVRSLAAQIARLFTVKDGVIRNHDMTRSWGGDLDHLATWFDVSRLSGESDAELRGRLLEYLDSYISSGTIDSVKAAIEAYTGVVPEISELWQSISYYNYNPDDYDGGLPPDQWRTYLYDGGSPDDTYTFQAYYYDEFFQLNSFFCILDYSVMVEHGIDNIKQILQKAKAAGVQGYLAWLLNEDFADTTLSNWTVVAP